MQEADVLHLVRSKLDQPDQASRALDISFATSTSVPKELYGQAVAELRRSEEHRIVHGLQMLSQLAQQADSVALADLVKEAVPLMSGLLQKSTAIVQDTVLSTALQFIQSAQAFGDQPGVRKDVSALATRCSSWIYSKGYLASDAGSVSARQQQLQLKLLQACLTVVPSSLRQLRGLGEALEQLLLSCAATCEAGQEAAACYALLPAATGTAEAWTQAAQRIISSASDLGAAVAAELQGLAALPATRAPSSQAGMDLSICAAATLKARMKLLRQLLYSLACMLGQTYPCPVPLPGQAVLALASAVLAMQPAALHNLPAATAAASTTALGSLQAASLQLLHALIRAGGPALLPLADGMARLFKPLLQAVADGAIGPMAHTPRGTETAVQAAEACIALLDMGGPGTARALAPSIHAFCAAQHADKQPQSPPAAGAPGKTGGKRNKKRRLEAEAAALAHGTALPAGSERERELARQTAGLKLLTSLLRVGGAWLPAEQRLQADSLCLQAAQAHTQAGPGQGSRSQASARAACQAALQALLTSVLVPCSHSPPFLAQALAVFRQEASGPDAELAQTAGYSLLALEALLHPRACPPAPTYTLKTPARPQPHPVQPNFHFGMPSPQLQPQQHQDQQGGSIVEAAGRQDAAVPMSADRGFLGGQQQPSANGGTAAGQQLHAGPSAALPRMSTADTASAGQAAEGPAGQLLSSHGQDENQAGPALQPESSMPTEPTPQQQASQAGVAQPNTLSSRQAAQPAAGASQEQQAALGTFQGQTQAATVLFPPAAEDEDDEPFPDIDSGPSGSSDEDEEE